MYREPSSSGDACEVETPVEAIKKEADVLQSMARTPQGAPGGPRVEGGIMTACLELRITPI